MLRDAPAGSAPSGGRQVVVAIGNRRVAVPAEHVVEVFRLASYTPLPCEDPANLGVGLHRERLIPIVDLARRLGLHRAGAIENHGLCLIVRTAWGELGCPVDEVVGLELGPGGASRDEFTVLDPVVLGGAHGESTAR